MRPLTALILTALCLAVASGAEAAGVDLPFGLGHVEQTGPALYNARCGGCHALDRNKYGPSHQGLFGRPSGTQPGYRYSRALEGLSVRWDEATLDRWLADPRAMAPGTRMNEAVRDPEERRLIIAYLKERP